MSKKAIRNWDINSVLKRLETKRKRKEKIIITFDKNGKWWGEDTNFCNMIRKAGFDFYGVVDGETTHHGTYGWKGKLIDTFQRADEKKH